MAVYTITAANSRFETTKNAFEDKTAGADTLTVQEGGYLLALNGHLGARLDDNGPWTVTVNGSIFAESDHAVLLASGVTKSTSKMTIGATGEIASGGNFAIQALQSVNISNAGVLFAGGSTVISLNGTGGASSLTNTGTVGSVGQLQAISAFVGSDNITVTNSGNMYGDILLTTGNDVITNNALIDGNIEFDEGNNRYTATKEDATVGDITADNGNDTVVNGGETDVISLGGGKNSITITKTGDSEALVTANGDDTILISGFVRQYVEAGDGKNSVTVAAGGTIFNVNDDIDALRMGGGNDTFSNAGRILGGINASSGDNTGTNKGLIEGNVFFSSGNDKLTNSGTIKGDVYLSNGVNSFTNSGTVEGTINGGVNADTLTNSNDLFGIVDLGDGADLFTNSGVTQAAIKMGAGNDKVVNTGFLLSAADLGAGDDTYIGGNLFDIVRDSDGLDNIKLGGGTDFYTATGAATGKDGLDIIDAGAGVDLYYADSSISNLRINLDNVAHDINPLLNTGPVLPDDVTAANTVTAASGTPDTGVDKITGFEQAVGGNGHDRIWGSAAVNTLAGGAGNDSLIGLAGNDILYGGTGGDTLVGGAGSDELWGNGPAAGADLVQDQFVFLSLADSGVTKTTRDRIMDFEDGKDRINVSIIDANTTIGGRQNFDYINDNGGPGQLPEHASFTGVAGQLRSYWTATGQMIEADVNGDKKADFSIELYDPTHGIVLSSADFILN